jgi:hypothetical protein
MVSNSTFITITITICVSFLGAIGGVVATLNARISDVRQDVRDLQRDLRDFKAEVAAALAKIGGE